MNRDCALLVDNLSAGYRDRIVIEGVSFCVKEGVFLGVIGPNGAGKTTLFKAILGIIPRLSGEVRIFGKPLQDAYHLIGYVPQYLEMETIAPISVAEMVSMGLVGSGIHIDQKRAWDEVMDRFSLKGIKDEKYNGLSMGQRQRVLIARALVKRPRLILLDEPTASLDEPTERDLFSLLGELKKQGTTIVMISHDIGAISQSVDEVACLNRSLVYHGRPGEELTEGIEKAYECPIDLLAHGIPHRVLKEHEK